MLTTTGWPASAWRRAMRTSEACPSCKAPIVGTKTPLAKRLRSAAVGTSSIAGRLTRSYTPRADAPGPRDHLDPHHAPPPPDAPRRPGADAPGRFRDRYVRYGRRGHRPTGR